MIPKVLIPGQGFLEGEELEEFLEENPEFASMLSALEGVTMGEGDDEYSPEVMEALMEIAMNNPTFH